MDRNFINLTTFQPILALQDIATAVPSLLTPPEADWDINSFGRVLIWSQAGLDQQQRLAIGQEWYNNIIQGEITVQTAIRGLRLSLSLKSMDPGNTEPLWSQQNRPAQATDVLAALVPVPATNLFGNTPFPLTAQQMVQGAQPLDLQAANVPNNLPPLEHALPLQDNDNMRSVSYCFLACYLMKLLVKSPENVVSGLDNMKRRFSSFYSPSRTVTDFIMNFAQATAYREALLSQSLVILTYTHAIANTHQYIAPALNPREVGVLSYLGFLPFSYTGMHAYTLLMELKGFTNIRLDVLLSLFYSDITSPAILKIAQIVRNYERTVAEPNRDVTFRYCTSWGPQYFSSIRSRNCTHLLYTVSCAWKTLAAGNPNADPERIVVTSRLSEQMKRTLKRAGEIIGESLKNKLLGGVSASPAFAMAVDNVVQPEPEGEADWDEI